jgi:acyl-CoA synthetase (AMP-forming)/AMP-acid ligase II
VAGTIACGLAAFLAGLALLVMSPAGLRNPAMVQGFWRLVAQYKATAVAGVPTSIGAILEVPLDGADISTVRFGVTGAALLPPAAGERFRQVTGRLFIAGRTKDLIIRSGHNIDPVMIENAMAEHPAVALAAAVGMPDAYAGELPVCFVMLRAGASVAESELHEHAQKTIGERPAWPKHFHIVDAIPTTSVGKIFKPELRCDAAARLVSAVLREQHRLPDAQVQVSAGGPRGLIVSVTLPTTAQAAMPAVTQALAGYLFEARVTVA